MNKKIILAGVVLLILIGGGIFLYLNQQAQNAVKDLNANLPEGVRVVKSLVGNEYKVVNKIDGYSFKTPSAWDGLLEIDYIAEETIEGYTFTTVEMQGSQGASTVGIVSKFSTDADIPLEEWVRANLNAFGLVRDLMTSTTGDFEVVIAKEGPGLFDMPIYFFRDGFVTYSITNPSEDFIKEVILSGSW